MGKTPPNPSRLANGQGLPPPLQPFTTCKWTAPQPFTTPPAPPPTLHDLQMDKGCSPPPPPNPSRLANGQTPPTLSRLENGQGLPPPPTHQTFTTCKWTRVGGPNPSRLANGPTLHDLQMDNGWTRVGAPRSSPHYQHYGWTRVGPPQPFAIWGGSPNNQHTFPSRPGALSEDRQINDRALRPRTYPNANLNFCLDKHWGLQAIERLSIFLRGPGASPQIETSMTSPSSQNVR